MLTTASLLVNKLNSPHRPVCSACPVCLQTNGQYALADSWCTESHVLAKANSIAIANGTAPEEETDPEEEMQQGAWPSIC